MLQLVGFVPAELKTSARFAQFGLPIPRINPKSYSNLSFRGALRAEKYLFERERREIPRCARSRTFLEWVIAEQY